jgi:hypothetical protein
MHKTGAQCFACGQTKNHTGGADGLKNFNNNTSDGHFTIQNGRNFSTIGNFNNDGILTVGNASTFSANGNFTNGGTLEMRSGSFNATGRFSNNGELTA